MRTKISEKIIKIINEIESNGEANLTRLTVLKKWFEHPYRLSSFGIFIAKQACTGDQISDESADLFGQAHHLLSTTSLLNPMIGRQEAEQLYFKLKAFQNDYKKIGWNSVRLLKNMNLYFIEEGLRIYLWRTDSPSDGYRLAAEYCENYDPMYGSSLNGPSVIKLENILSFMSDIEALEDQQPVFNNK
jgi:hypothetical protein